MHNNFIMSQKFNMHPVLKANYRIRERYCCTLKYFIDQASINNQYITARMEQYIKLFIGEEFKPKASENIDCIIKSIVNNFLKPWRRKYRFFLLCDLAFILVDKSMVQNSLKLLKRFLSKKQCIFMDEFFKILFVDNYEPSQKTCADVLLNQFRINWKFINQIEKRVLVTANMSAGKSTLINSIIGKSIARTSQEACTANIYYLYNKVFEDNLVHLLAPSIDLNVTKEKLLEKSESEKNHIASYFRTTVQLSHRICLIDTPGVNSVLDLNHGKLTRNAFHDEQYDTLIYVFNACRLGTDEEFKYLKYISENIPKEKIIFVINKLDDYKAIDDSIELSINGIKHDLLQLGYKNPIICPISAYFAFLIKKIQAEEELTEDEKDSFELFSKKFNKPEYDLSRYYAQKEQMHVNDNELSILSKKCGIYGLESIIFRS